MVQKMRVRSTHPWIHVNTVVFASDTIGIDERGRPARVDRDVVVTAIVSAPEGGKLVSFRVLRHFTVH